jgi:response regulator RpfG family c-di-GMP phosphodiesterase
MQKILIAEDDEQQLQMLKDLLTACNYQVFMARNGQEAIDSVIKYNPDLVILDIQMPVLDGYSACVVIKKMKGFIPVILLTVLGDLDDRIKGYEYGADEFISKPYHSTELMTRVRNLLIRKNLFDKMQSILTDIDTLTTQSQRAIERYENDRFKFDEWSEELIGKILQDPCEPSKSGHEYIILYSPSSIKSENMIFWKENGKMRGVPLLLPQEIVNIIPKEEAVFEQQPKSELKKLLEDFILKTIKKRISILNYVLYFEPKGGIIGINFRGAHGDFHTIFFKEVSLILNFFKMIQAKIKEIDDAFRYMIIALSKASEAHDDDTGAHLLRVNEYAKVLADEINMEHNLANTLYYSAQMHDVGKIMIPADIIRKPGPLTHEEFEIMKQHTILGAKILGSASKLAVAREVALYHHENFDGTGYPHGIDGDNIPLTARIVKIADIYDALRSKRPYKEAFSHQKACECILKGDRRTLPSHFDPELLKAFKIRNDLFNEIYETYKDYK